MNSDEVGVDLSKLSCQGGDASQRVDTGLALVWMNLSF